MVALLAEARALLTETATAADRHRCRDSPRQLPQCLRFHWPLLRAARAYGVTYSEEQKR